jgi:hypothetical protein
MRRKRAVVVCLLAFLVGAPLGAFAQGGGKGWIERFSGPGPWHGAYGYSPFACVAKQTPERGGGNEFTHLFQCNNGAYYERSLWWFEVEYGEYQSDADPVVNDTTVRLKSWEVRATTLVGSTRDIVGVGFGAGGYHFSGENFDSFGKFKIPLRVSVFPLRAVLPSRWHGRWGNLVQFWTNATFVAGRLSGEDFGVPGSSFDENWEVVPSFGILVDARDLIFR